MSQLADILATLDALSPEQRAQVEAEAMAATRHMLWVPNPGPQTDAYHSAADILLYGGEPGGGKTQLAVGLAFNCHKRSLLLRRQYTDLDGLIDAALKINGSRRGFSGQPPPRLTIGDGKFIDFGAAARLGDEQRWMGRAHDLIVPDEGTQFLYEQIRFLIGWLRHEDPKQRTRVLIPTNPPLTTEGLWVFQMFAPWIDDKFHNPAEPGELRWAVTDDDGKDVWVDGPEPVVIKGKKVNPMSRTFIPSSVDDNPYYAAGSYRDKLDSMIEPFRSILMGGFKTTFKDHPDQIIPTAWIRAAIERWTEKPRAGVPMCAIGADATGGGADPMVLAPRYDGWYAPLIEVPGKDIPIERAGTVAAGIVVTHRRDQAVVVVDMGGGYGGPMFEHLRANDIECIAYKGSEAATGRTRDRQLGFFNFRSQAIWRFREALDPDQDGGSTIALPDDPVLVADLASYLLDLSFNGIKAEAKEKLVARMGRSPNRGDAVIMAWVSGPTHLDSGRMWAAQQKRSRIPQQRAIMGRAKR